MKQPALGITASLVVMVVSLGFVALFAAPTFMGWVSYLTICFIPIEVIAGVIWGCKQPAFAAARPQPAKGVMLVLVCLVVGAIVAAVHFVTVAGSIGPPPPMAMMCIITSVIMTFWLALMFGGWPFVQLIKNPVAAGLTLLAACYVVNFLQFRILFDYGFMRGAPVYVASLDPHGLFNAWRVLVFEMSALSVLFLMLHFDLWPFTKSPALMKQPVLGLVWTALALVLGGLAYYLFVNLGGMDVVAFLVEAPIPFIFGTIIVLNMLQGSLFRKLEQPMRGVVSAVVATALGVALARIYGALAPAISGPVNPGPPSYDFEIWLASALLAVTFPFLIFFADFFEMWPLKRAAALAVGERAASRRA
ncbi:MAG TPA: hypothetical protein VKV17_14325 [Bryobacteraceae bacterium]|nr:hypothetical protein [Bryobacteraceae bacterium]